MARFGKGFGKIFSVKMLSFINNPVNLDLDFVAIY